MSRSDEVLLTQAMRDCATKSGWLTKQGATYKTWRKRFCILTDQRLFYLKDLRDSLPRGVLLLDADTAFRCVDGQARRPFLFSLEPALSFSDGKKWHKRVYLFEAQSEDERAEWQTAVASAVRLPSQPSVPVEDAPPPPPPPQQPAAHCPDDAVPPPSTITVAAPAAVTPVATTTASDAPPGRQQLTLVLASESAGFVHGCLQAVWPLLGKRSTVYVPTIDGLSDVHCSCLVRYDLSAAAATVAQLAASADNYVVAALSEQHPVHDQLVAQCVQSPHVTALLDVAPPCSDSEPPLQQRVFRVRTVPFFSAAQQQHRRAIDATDAGCIVTRALLRWLRDGGAFPLAQLVGVPLQSASDDCEDAAREAALLGQPLLTPDRAAAIDAFLASSPASAVQCSDAAARRLLFDRIPPEIGIHLINRLLDSGLCVRVALPPDGRVPVSLQHPNLDIVHDDAGLDAALADVSYLVVHNPFPSDSSALLRMQALLQHAAAARPPPLQHAYLLSGALAALTDTDTDTDEDSDASLCSRARKFERLFVAACPPGVATTIVRTGLLSENVVDLFTNALARPPHALVLPLKSSRLVSLVSAADVGLDVANIIVGAPALFAGRTVLLTGREALTFDQIASFLTSHAREFFLGSTGAQPPDICFLSCTAAEYDAALRAAAISPSVAASLLDLFTVLNSRGPDYSPPLQCQHRSLQSFSLFVESTMLRLLAPPTPLSCT